MKRLGLTSIFIALLMIISCSFDNSQTEDQESSNEDIYFPSLNSGPWETKTLAELNWNEAQLQPLLDYLDQKNTKIFMILHEGQIVVEAYGYK